MVANFTVLASQRRTLDVSLAEARRCIARMEGSVAALSRGASSSSSLAIAADNSTTTADSDSSAEAEAAVVILSADVDCQRRTLDALCRLDDEKQRLLDRQAEAHARDARLLRERFGCGELAGMLEELRQSEQRARDVEDALLAETTGVEGLGAAAREAAAAAAAGDEERHLLDAIRAAEADVAALDARLRAVTARDADVMRSERDNQHHHARGAATYDEHSLQFKKGALRSKIAARATVVQRLAIAAEGIADASPPPHQHQQQQQHAGAGAHHRPSLGAAAPTTTMLPPAGGGAADAEADAMSSSMRSSSDAHRVMSLIKAAVCHLRDDYDEISTTIARYMLDRQHFAGDARRLADWARGEWRRQLYDIGRIAASVLEDQADDEDADGGASVYELLRTLRRLVVLIDVLAPAMGKRELYRLLREADEGALLPQLYQIAMAALEVRDGLRRLSGRGGAPAADASGMLGAAVAPGVAHVSPLTERRPAISAVTYARRGSTTK